MNIIVDLDLNQVVESWGSRNPAPAIQVKSQDTPTFAIYFARGNINYDIGTSPGLRFGLYQAGSPNALVQTTTFTRTTDAQNRVVYVAYPNFNTTAMLAAIGTSQQLSAIGELRYQTSFGTIARTLDIPFTVLRSLLIETSLDTTIAAFTTPAVGSNVTVRINNTGWLSNNLNISIGAGAGAYKVVSITNTTDFVAQNLGGANNAASGTNIPSGTNVGIAPPNVIGAFPDPSIIEVTTHKNVANGYAGLTSAAMLATTIIPVDTQTVRFNSNGQLSSSAIMATTTANFTTPAANANVQVTLASSSGLIAGAYIRIPIAGYYSVVSIDDATHATIKNIADPFNAAGGTTITSGAVLLPAQAVSGGGGGGQPAYTQTTASFVVPAVGSTVPVTVASTAWMGGNGYYVFITGAGYYAVQSITDATHAVLTNAGGASNATPGVTVPSGATVSAAGPAGAAGSPGQGLAAYDALSAGFTMPAAGANVTISIGSTAWVGQNQVLYIASAGYMSVIAISSATQLNVQNLNYPGNASSGTSIVAGSHVGPGGLQGAQGAGGAGLNAFTNLAANFTQPAVNSTVTINVGTSAWIAAGQGVYVQGGGYYQVSTVPDLTHVTLTNLGTAGNAAPAATITSGSTVMVTPSGTPGSGVNSFTTISASFTQPAVGSNVTVTLGSTTWMVQNQYLFVNGGGTYQVVNINDATHAILQSVAATGNVVSGSTVPAGSGVSPSGPAGPQGPSGPSGGISDAPSDGNTYGRKNAAWSVVSSGAGPVYPSARAFEDDDFTGYIQTNNAPNGKLQWNLKTAGGGTATNADQTGVTAAGKGLGVWKFTVTTSGDLQMISQGPGAGITAPGIIVPGLGICDVEFRIWIGALPTGADDLIVECGLGANFASATGPYGADVISFFYYYGGAYTNWQLQTSKAGTKTLGNTGVAVTAGNWWKLHLAMDAAWANITPTINGTAYSAATANIPTNNLMPFFRVYKGGGTTAISAYIDYFYRDYQFTR